MEYECTSIPLVKVLIGPNGSVEPLCNECKTIDCSNPVACQSVSLMGIVRKWRLLGKGSGGASVVVECKGFSK